MAKYARVCPTCGSRFIASCGQQRYCCAGCRPSQNTYYIPHSTTDRVVTYCDYCNKIVKRYLRPSRLKTRKHTFCSKQCFYKFYSTHHPLATTRSKHTCTHCGETFELLPCDTRRGRGAFCSKKCRDKHQRGNNHPNYSGRIEITCQMCKTVFHVVPSKENTARFCSRDCRDKYHSLFHRGANSTNWKGGYDPYYGPNWLHQREKARDRDQYTCQACGVNESALDTQLHVHHIIAFRCFGRKQYKEANALSNLISLCGSCHTSTENTA